MKIGPVMLAMGFAVALQARPVQLRCEYLKNA